MYLLTSKWTLNRDVSDDEAKQLAEPILEVVRQQPGLRHYYGVRVDARTLLAINLWESEEHAQKAQQPVAGKAQEVMGPVGASNERLGGEVAIEI